MMFYGTEILKNIKVKNFLRPNRFCSWKENLYQWVETITNYNIQQERGYANIGFLSKCILHCSIKLARVEYHFSYLGMEVLDNKYILLFIFKVLL